MEDVLGRENAKKNLLRSSVLASLEGAGGYPEYKRHAKALDAFPADQGEGGDEWKEDEDGATSAAGTALGLSQILTHCFIAQLVTVCPYIAIYKTDTFLLQSQRTTPSWFVFTATRVLTRV